MINRPTELKTQFACDLKYQTLGKLTLPRLYVFSLDDRSIGR